MKIKIGHILSNLLIFYIFGVSFLNTSHYLIQLIIVLSVVCIIRIWTYFETYNTVRANGKKINGMNSDERYEMYIVDKKTMGNHNVAAVSLWGSSIIFIEENVFQKLNEKEMDSIVLHERGHLEYGHGYKSFVFRYTSVGLAICSNYLTGNKSFQVALPFVILGIGALVLYNLYIRKNEYIADKYAIEYGANKEDLISALSLIHSMNAQDTKKGKLVVNTHPILEKRIKRIESY